METLTNPPLHEQLNALMHSPSNSNGKSESHNRSTDSVSASLLKLCIPCSSCSRPTITGNWSAPAGQSCRGRATGTKAPGFQAVVNQKTPRQHGRLQTLASGWASFTLSPKSVRCAMAFVWCNILRKSSGSSQMFHNHCRICAHGAALACLT